MARRTKLALLIAPLLLATIAIGLVLRDDSPARPVATGPQVRPAAPHPQILLVRRRGGVPDSWAARLRGISGVTAIARTARAQALLRRSRRSGGATVDLAPPGYAIPLDVLVARPGAYASVLSQARTELGRLRRGTALLSRTSARQRRLGVGDRLHLVGGSELRIAGVVDDALAGRAELVMSRRLSGDKSGRTGQLLVATTQPRRIERRLASDETARVQTVSPAVNPSTRLIARAVEIKARFGEFAVRLPYGEDWIGIEPGWLRRNVVTRTVPILGAVTCNRRLFPPLRRALRTLERRGLSRIVNRSDYAGCYAPRRIPGSGSLSLHAWGLAIDLNAAANPRLRGSRQDRRLVAAMEDAGFTWGGRWPTVPDPMHFELHSLPRAP